MTPGLQLQLLGTPSVTFGDEVRLVSGRRNGQIASILGLRVGQRTSHRLLSEVLFPNKAGLPPSSIRTYVSRSRKALSPLKIDGSNGYALELDEDAIDVAQFARCVASGDDLWSHGNHESAVANYRTAEMLWMGEPFSALSDWVQARIERGRLEELHEHAAERTLTWRLATEDSSDLVAELDAAQRSQPFREIRTALVMRALAESGRHGEASRTFTRHCHFLSEEMGLTPSPALLELDALIVRGEALSPLIAQRDPVPAVVPEHLREASPIGRDSELAHLKDVFRRASFSDRPVLVQILGAAGLGKSTLVRWATVSQLGIQAGCNEAEQHGSLRPVRSLLSSLIRGWSAEGRAALFEDHPALGWVLPSDSQPIEPGYNDEVPEGRRYEIFDSFVALLHRQSRPSLIAVDDIQWADEQTLSLIAHIVRYGPGGLTVVTAARPEELRQELDTHDLETDEIVLAPLDDESLLRIVADNDLQRGVPEEESRLLVRRAGGNPFFAIELARSNDQHLGDDLPAAVSRVLNRRLSGLEDTSRIVVELLWAAGGELGHEALVRAIAGSSQEVISALDEVTSSGIAVQRIHDATVIYDIAHDLLRAFIEESIPPVRRFDLHHRLALAVDPLVEVDESRWVDQAALNWHQAGRLGNPERVERVCFDAGLRAYQACSFGAAERQFLRCLDGVVWQGAQGLPRSDVELWLARCSHRLGRADIRRERAKSAFATALTANDTEIAAQAALTHGGDRSTYGVSNAETTALLDRALAMSGMSEANTAEIEARLAQERHHALDFDESDQLSARALQRKVPAVSRMRALAGRVWVLNHPDFLDERIGLIEEMEAAAQASGNDEYLLQAHIWMASAMLESGDTSVVDSLIAEARDLSERVRVQPLEVRVATLTACRAFMTGDLTGAMDAAQRAFELGLVAEPENANQVLQAQMIGPLRELGQLPAMLPMISEMAAEFTLAPGWECALAFALAEAGDVEKAEGIITRHLAHEFTLIPRDLAWFRALTYIAEASATIGMQLAAQPLLGMLRPFTGRNVALWDIESGGSCDHYLGLLSALEGDNAAAVSYFDVAMSFNNRTGQPHRALRSAVHGALSRAELGDATEAISTLDGVFEQAESKGFVELAERANRSRVGLREP